MAKVPEELKKIPPELEEALKQIERGEQPPPKIEAKPTSRTRVAIG